MKVTIYALIDPITCKVKYIGRTSTKLNDRLSGHIHASKYYTRHTHKENWIRSLLKINSRPLIRKLVEVEGWEESYKLEVSLISKYKDRLTNYYDKGPGKLRSCKEEDRIKISNTLKRKYKDGSISLPKGTTVYVYNRDGSFFKEFSSVPQASKELDVYHGTIYKHIYGNKPQFDIPTKDLRKRFLRSKYQFSTIKVDKMHNYEK